MWGTGQQLARLGVAHDLPPYDGLTSGAIRSSAVAKQLGVRRLLKPQIVQRLGAATFAALLLHALASAAAPLDPLGPEMTARYPAITVPQTTRTPVLDGKINEGEYGPITALPDLVTLVGDDKGTAAPLPTRVWLSYSARALYVAFWMAVPEGARPKVTVSRGRDAGFEDDAFEIFLVRGDRDGEQFHIGGNAAGVTWERNLEGGSHTWAGWDPQLRYATYVEAGAWGGEFEIPWSELGGGPPQPGEIWRANFIANRHTPATRAEAWSYWNQWRDRTGNGRLIFGAPNQPYFSCGSGWRDAWEPHRRGMFPHVKTPLGTKDPRQIEVMLQLLRRELNPADAGSFYTELHKKRAQATGEAATFAAFEDDVKDTLATFKPVESLTTTKQLPDPNFTGGWGPKYRINKEGDYLLRYWFKDVTDPHKPFVIAGGALPFRMRANVHVVVTPYLLTRRSVVITADLRAVRDLSQTARLHGFITAMHDQKVLAAATLAYAKGTKQDLEVSVENLPVGHDYKAHVQLLDAAGMVRHEAWAPFKRPTDPDWWVHRDTYGAHPEVPPPWTPIAWRHGAAQVWGRTITFGNMSLPQQIVNHGEAILAAPIRLELAGGKQFSQGKTAITAHRPGHVTLESIAEAAGIRLRAVHTFEFDGFSLVDLFIEPVGQAARLEGLTLVIPIKAQFATFLTNYRNAPGPGKAVPRYVGKTPQQYVSPVMLTTWLGTDHLGLEWSCESSRDWALAHPDEAIVVEHKGDVVEARFRFVDRAITLDRVRHIRFGLIATPTKPVPLERRNWRIDFASTPPPIPGKSLVGEAPHSRERVTATKEHLQKYWQDRAGIDVQLAPQPGDWSGHSFWHPRVTDQERVALIRAQERLLKEHGMWVLRHGGWAVAPYAPEWDPWGKEMLAWPKEPTFAAQFSHSYASPFVEFFVGSWAYHARELGMRGIRFDTVFPWRPSENPYLGEAWTASDGKTYGSQNLFRQREMMKRLYRILHGGEVSGGLIYHPLAGPPIMTVESFVDIHEVGEGIYMRTTSLKEGYVQEQMRVWMTDRPYGFVAVNNMKGSPLTPNQRIGALLAAGADPRLLKRPGVDIASYAARDDRMPTSRLWDAWSWIDRSTAQWWPHWENQEKITTRASARGEHYVSLHLQPGRRVLLVAVNYEPQPQEITVVLRADRLGFPPGTALAAQDAITGKPVEMQGHTLKLACGPELYRYVKLAPLTELHGPPLDQRH